MQHLLNCHGEWNLLLGAICSVPFIGVWLKLKFTKKNV